MHRSQRVPERKEKTRNYRESGAKKRPFAQSDSRMRVLGVSRPDAQHISAEKYPWESVTQGGRDANLFPVTNADQTSQYPSSLMKKDAYIQQHKVIVYRVSMPRTASLGTNGSSLAL
jgi:hypothetical protein